MDHIEVFDTTVEKTNIWLKELMAELDLETKKSAYYVLRSVLHALRDRLSVTEAADLGAQLPMLIRGFYYEGWRPQDKPLKIRTKADFIELAKISETHTKHDPEEVIKGVFRVLNSKISAGEVRHVERCMPEGLRELWH